MSFTDDLKGRVITLWKNGVEFSPPFPECVETIDTTLEKVQGCSPCIVGIKEDNDTST